MTLLMPKTLILSDGERHTLHSITSETQHAATDRAYAAKIILMASEGQTHREEPEARCNAS
jgi:hypothetical protein